MIVKCLVCGKKFNKKPSRIKRSKNINYCSSACKYKGWKLKYHKFKNVNIKESKNVNIIEKKNVNIKESFKRFNFQINKDFIILLYEKRLQSLKEARKQSISNIINEALKQYFKSTP